MIAVVLRAHVEHAPAGDWFRFLFVPMVIVAVFAVGAVCGWIENHRG